MKIKIFSNKIVMANDSSLTNMFSKRDPTDPISGQKLELESWYLQKLKNN